MNRLHQLTASIIDSPASADPRVELRIDGASLLDLVREAERPFALCEGVPALAGNYAWPRLTPRLVTLLSGQAHDADPQRGVLLNCECGWPACWPLSVRVRVFDRLVTWQEVRQLKRPARWTYPVFEPMRFARAGYLDQIGKLRDELAQACAL